MRTFYGNRKTLQSETERKTNGGLLQDSRKQVSVAHSHPIFLIVLWVWWKPINLSELFFLAINEINHNFVWNYSEPSIVKLFFFWLKKNKGAHILSFLNIYSTVIILVTVLYWVKDKQIGWKYLAVGLVW